jgi:anti-sigma B factor antagonist
VNEHRDLLTIDRHDDTNACRLDIVGEIDVHTCSDLEEAVRQALDEGCSRVVLGMAGVTFIDSSGLRALITSRREAEERSIDVRLHSPSPAVVRLLQLTGLAELFPDD